MLTRSVLTASPADLSFASRSDDFGGASTTQDIDDLDESDLSPSLLYCLDGNEPTLASPFGNSNGRKRSAGTPLKSTLITNLDADNKENMENLQEDHSRTKKLLITSPEKYPGETAL